MSKQYFIKVIRGSDGEIVYFNFGMDKHKKYTNTETCLSDYEYISITCYSLEEYKEYKEHLKSVMVSDGKLSIHI